MPRIAYLSPLPPAPTGIARYSGAVLDRLRSRPGFEVEAIWPRSLDEGERLVRECDLAVYHVGNNLRFHRQIYALAIRHPGLVVLHDLGLDDFAAGLDASSDPLGPPTRAEARAAAGHLGASGLEVDEPLRTPWCALLARRARGVIVHAPFGRRYLEAIGSRTPVHVVPHPPIREPGGWRAARADRRVRRRLGGRGPVIGILGDVGRAKGIEAVLAVLERIEGATLAIVGRRIPGFDVRAAVRAAGVGDRVIVEQDVSDAAFGAWLRACDLVVNLRHPHRGEVSGTLVRAAQAGVPVVVSATGTYLDWPEDAVVRVPPGPPDAGALAWALGELVADPDRRRRIGERARAYVEGLEREDATGAGYAGAIASTLHLLRDPVRMAVARWARVFGDLGTTEEDLHLAARYAEAILDLGTAE